MKTQDQLINEKYFIDLYNSMVEEINDELDGMGMGKERKISRVKQAKFEIIESCEDLSEAYEDLGIS